MDSSTPFTMVPDTNYCNIIVPTMDTVQMSYLLGLLLTNHRPVSAPALPCLTQTKAKLGGSWPSHRGQLMGGWQLLLHQTLCES